MNIQQEFDKSFLYVEYDIDIEKEYIIHMLTENRIDGIIECTHVEGESVLKYNISNKMSLKKMYEIREIESTELKRLIRNILNIYKEAREYFIPGDGFVLKPEWIFYDMYTEKMGLIFIPGDATDRIIYRDLADFILDRINHNDERCVKIAYMFYKYSKEENFSLESFLNIIEKEEVIENRKATEEKLIKTVEEESEDIFIPDEEEKTNGYKKAVLLLIIGIILLVTYFYVRKYSVYATAICGGGVVVICISIIMIIKKIIIRIKEKEEEDVEKRLNFTSVEDYFGAEKKEYSEEKTQFFNIGGIKDCKLEWKEDGFKKSYNISAFPVVIGKLSGEVDCIINDASISRMHAKLEKRGQDIFISDLASTNGVFVDGKRLSGISSVKVLKTSEIYLGNVGIRIC